MPKKKPERRIIFENFKKFIQQQSVEPDEVCQFIYSLLNEEKYTYRPTGCYGREWKLLE